MMLLPFVQSDISILKAHLAIITGNPRAIIIERHVSEPGSKTSSFLSIEESDGNDTVSLSFKKQGSVGGTKAVNLSKKPSLKAITGVDMLVYLNDGAALSFAQIGGIYVNMPQIGASFTKDTSPKWTIFRSESFDDSGSCFSKVTLKAVYSVAGVLESVEIGSAYYGERGTFRYKDGEFITYQSASRKVVYYTDLTDFSDTPNRSAKVSRPKWPKDYFKFFLLADDQFEVVYSIYDRDRAIIGGRFHFPRSIDDTTEILSLLTEFGQIIDKTLSTLRSKEYLTKTTIVEVLPGPDIY